MRNVFSIVLLFSALGFSHSALAVKQCIKNSSGTSLNVEWKTIDGKTSKNASNSKLTLGLTACKEGASLGYAVVSCNGCALAQPFAQAAVVVGGGILLGACVAATAGACLGPGMAAIAPLVNDAVRAIPNSDWKKRVAMPQDGQTMTFIGSAFDLRLQ